MSKHKPRDRRQITRPDQEVWTVAVEGLKRSYTQSYSPDAGTPSLSENPDVSVNELTNLGYDPARWRDLIGPSSRMLKTSPPVREVWSY
jgi:hypothetical protein